MLVVGSYLNEEISKLLKILYFIKLEDINKIELSSDMIKEVRSIIDEYYERNVPVNLKARKILTQLTGY